MLDPDGGPFRAALDPQADPAAATSAAAGGGAARSIAGSTAVGAGAPLPLLPPLDFTRATLAQRKGPVVLDYSWGH